MLQRQRFLLRGARSEVKLSVNGISGGLNKSASEVERRPSNGEKSTRKLGRSQGYPHSNRKHGGSGRVRGGGGSVGIEQKT